MTHRFFVHSNGLNVRNRPTTEGSEVVGSLEHGAMVEVDRKNAVRADGYIWRRVVTIDEEWVAQVNLSTGEQYLKTTKPEDSGEGDPDPIEPENPTQTLIVATGVVNVRNLPTLVDSIVVKKLKRDDEIEVYENQRQVGENGWVWRKIVDEERELWAAEINRDSGIRLLRPKGTVVNGRVQTDGTRFLVDGNSFRFIGANFRELAYYGRIIPNTTNTPVVEHTTLDHRKAQLQGVKDLGMRVVRIYASHRRVDDEHSIAWVKDALDIIHEHGLLAIVCINDSVGLSNFYVHGDDHFHKVDDVKHPDRVEYYRNGGWRDNLLPYTKKIVAALKEHPAIFAWGLGNEYAVVPWPGTKEDGNSFLEFAHTLAETIRGIDDQHLITTGLVNTVHVMPEGETQANFARRLYESDFIDFGTVHIYQVPHRSDILEPLEEQRSKVDLEVLKSLGKPLIIEEFGSAFGCNNRLAFTRDNLTEWFQLGIAGVMQWGVSIPDKDIGVGDTIWGMDRYSEENKHMYNGLVKIYREWAQRLDQGSA